MSALLKQSIYMFECQFKFDTVYRLQVHFPDFQTVIFLPGEKREALQREGSRVTTLTAWFKRNVEYDRMVAENTDTSGMTDPRSLQYYQLL
ncbi:hypothetical protein Aduo_009580 [Ancylostoma duodenale]